MANIERLKQVLQLIKENPKHWNQAKWHCGTSHCFAGFADCLAAGVGVDTDTNVILGLNESVFSFVEKGKRTDFVSQEWLGLNDRQANDLFYVYNTLEDLELIIKQIEKGEL